MATPRKPKGFLDEQWNSLRETVRAGFAKENTDAYEILMWPGRIEERGYTTENNADLAALLMYLARPTNLRKLYNMVADPHNPGNRSTKYDKYRNLYNLAAERNAAIKADYAEAVSIMEYEASHHYAVRITQHPPLDAAAMRERYGRLLASKEVTPKRITLAELRTQITAERKDRQGFPNLSKPAQKYLIALIAPDRTDNDPDNRFGEVPAPVPEQVRLALAHWFGDTFRKQISRPAYFKVCPWQLFAHVPELALLQQHIREARRKTDVRDINMVLAPIPEPPPPAIPLPPLPAAPLPSSAAPTPGSSSSRQHHGHHGGGPDSPITVRSDRSRRTREGTQQSYSGGGFDDFGGFDDDDDDDDAPGPSNSGHGGRAASREATPPPAPRRKRYDLAATSAFHTLSATIQKSKSLSGRQRDMWREGNIGDTNRLLDPATNADLAGLVDFVARPPHFIHLDIMATTDPEEGGYPNYEPLWRHARAAKVALEQEYADKLARFNARAERHYRQPGCRVRMLTRHEMRERYKKMVDTPRPTPGSNRLKTFKSLMQSKATKTLSEIAKEAVLFFFDPFRTAADPRQRLGDLPGADVLCPDLGRELAAWFSEVAKKKLGRIEYLDVLPEPIFASFPELEVLRDHFHDMVRGGVSKNDIWIPDWVPRGGEGGGGEPSPPESGHHHHRRRHHQQQQPQTPQPQPSSSQQQAPPPSLPQQQQAHYQQEDLYGTPTPPRQLQPHQQQQQQPHQAAAHLEPPAQPELRRSSSSKRRRHETTSSSSSSSDDDDEVEVISSSRHRHDDRDDRGGGGRKKSSRDKQPARKSRDKDSSSSRTQPSGSSKRRAAPAAQRQPSTLGRIGAALGLGGTGGASSSSSSSRHPHSSSSASNRQQAERSGGGGGGHPRSSREAAAPSSSSSRRNAEPSSSSSRRTSGGGSGSRRERHRDDPTTPSAPVANMAPLPEHQQLQPGVPDLSQMMPAAHYQSAPPVPTTQTLVSRPAAPTPGSGVVAYAPPLEVVHSTDGGNTLRGAHGGGGGGGYNNDNYGQYYDGGGHHHHDPNAYRR